MVELLQRPEATRESDPSKQILMALFASTAGWSLTCRPFLLLFVAPTIGALFFPTNVPPCPWPAVYAAFRQVLRRKPIARLFSVITR